MLGLQDASIFHDNLIHKLSERVGNTDGLEELGLLDDIPVEKMGTPLDTLSNYLVKKLEFGNDI